MDQIPIKLPTHYRNNLIRLAEYLEALPRDYEHFDMATYLQSSRGSLYPSAAAGPEGGDFYLSQCGCAACAAGHGPAAGIPIPNGCNNWDDYVDACLIPEESFNEGPLFGWCFSGSWADTDNTPHGAAKRIRYALKHGVPHNWVVQMLGHEPLCYE